MNRKNQNSKKIQLSKTTIVPLQTEQCSKVKGGDGYIVITPAPPKPQTYGCTYYLG